MVKATSTTIQIPPFLYPSSTIAPSQEPTLTHTPSSPLLRLGYIKRLNCDIISYIAKALLEEATDKPDSKIAAQNLVILRDDLPFFSVYNPAPLLRDEAFELIRNED